MEKFYKIFKNIIFISMGIFFINAVMLKNVSAQLPFSGKGSSKPTYSTDQLEKFKNRTDVDMTGRSVTPADNVKIHRPDMEIEHRGNLKFEKQADGSVKATSDVTSVEFVKGHDTGTPVFAESDNEKKECPNALKPDPNLNVSTPNSSNLFANSILTGMQNFMWNVYKSLAKLMMLGHALVCYATQIDYTCIGIESVTGCAGKFPNLNFLISGAMIYISGTLMSLAIGMYFVDISFKLGFAVLFMPISIALWPFPPTKNKLSENLSIIIRTGMLFMMIAVAVSFAIILIKNGVFNPQTISEDQFWNDIANKSTSGLAEGFSLDTTKILVILFCLIYGFKILSNDINKYLDYFFSDAVFGSESPMHMMGTQAFGMVTQNTIKPLAQYTKDVALTQTGRFISGLGTGIGKLATAQGRKELADGARSIGRSMSRGIRSTTRAIANPQQTYNQAMQYSGELANKGVRALGNVAKEAADIAIIPFTADQELRDKVATSIDKGFSFVGNKAENVIAHGGGIARNAAINAVKNVTDTEKQKDFIARTGAATLNALNATNPINPETGTAAPITPEQVRETLHSLNSVLQNKTQSAEQALMAQAVQLISQNSGKSEAEVRQTLQNFGQKVNNLTVKGKNLGNTAMHGGVALAMAAKTGVLGLLSIPDKGVDLMSTLANNIPIIADKAANTKVGKQLSSAITWLNDQANQAPVTLQPSALISAPFTAIRKTADAAYNWQETLKNITYAKDALKTLKAQNKKVILKKTGEIAVRTIVGVPLRTAKGTAKEGLSAVGSLLKGFGDSLADNSGHKTHFTSWSEMREAEEAKRQAAREEAAEFRSLADKYDK